jgi:hypothetical protein
MSARVGPVVMQIAGDAFTQSCQIGTMVWVGSSTAGDICRVKHRIDNQLLWEAITNGAQTYLGANFGASGMTAPNGFYLETISSGKLLVYLKE